MRRQKMRHPGRDGTIAIVTGRLEGKRVLVTHADRYIGPPVVDLFRAEGADVVADTTDYTTGPEVAAQVVADAGEIDVLVANFAGPYRRMPVTSMIGDVREFDDANANGQPIRLTLLSSGPRRAPAAADRGSLFDRIEKPSRSMFERIDSSEDVPRRRGGGGRRDDRSYSPRKGLRVPEGVDRYEPGGRDSRSPMPGRRGGGRERGGRRPGARREESGRGGGRGGKREDGKPAGGPRPKKTAEELDAEMEDYFGGGGGGNGGDAEAGNGNAQQQNGGGSAPAAPAAVGDDDIDMIE